MATDAKVGSELIQVLALDADIGNNSLVFYSILAIHYFRALANDSEDMGQVFTMGRGLVTDEWPPAKTSLCHCMDCSQEEMGSVWTPQSMAGQPARMSVLPFIHPSIHHLSS